MWVSIKLLEKLLYIKQVVPRHRNRDTQPEWGSGWVGASSDVHVRIYATPRRINTTTAAITPMTKLSA